MSSPSSDSLDQIVDLAAVEAMAERWCSGVEPELLSGADAARGAERFAVVIRRFEAAQLRLATRAEACNAYAARAHSAADWLATQNGTSKADAIRALDTAKRLDACPATRAAFEAGEISRHEADAVSGAATADPTCEQRLLDGARTHHDLRETRRTADKVRRAARSAEDEAARHARLHKTRSLRISESPEGHVEIRGQFTPAAFSGVKPVIDAHMKVRVDQARRDGTRDSWDAYRADAFLNAITAGATPTTRTPAPPTTTRPAPSATPASRSVASASWQAAPSATPATAAAPASSSVASAPSPAAPSATASPELSLSSPSSSAVAPAASPAGSASADHTNGAGENQGRLFSPGDDLGSAQGLDPKVNWNLVILVDGIALKRGYTAPGETCEIPGIGPIPVAWIETLLPDIHTEMLIHDAVDIRAYATTTRHRTRPVDLAVRVRDRHCTVPRCHRDVAELDHIDDFADTHDTSVANLHGMCNANHDDKTYRHATFTRDDTHWHWWPPGTDPDTTPPLRAPIGTHLGAWNLDHLPDPDPPPSLDLS